MTEPTLIKTEKTIEEIDQKATGENCRRFRKQVGVSLSKVSRKMGFTPPYVSDLELGKRKWRAELLEAYVAAIKSTEL